MADPIAQLVGGWASELNVYSIVLRIALSMLLSATIGCERARKRHSAGLRTFVLVSLSGTAAVILDISLSKMVEEAVPILSAATVIAAAMIGGSSVLYGSNNRVKGLTTSAGLWVCCLLGICAGAGLYTMTLILFAAIFGNLSLLLKVERFLKERSNHFEVHLELKKRGDLRDFMSTIRELGIRIDEIESNPAYITSGLSVYTVAFTIDNEKLAPFKKSNDLIKALSMLDCVYHIEELR